MSDQKIKTSADKPAMALVPQRALIGAARVFSYGAKKYAAGNFFNATLEDGAGQRYISAALRHLSEMQESNGLHTPESLATLDPESGLPHIDHVLCGLMMLRSIMAKCDALEVDPGVGKEPSRIVQGATHTADCPDIDVGCPGCEDVEAWDYAPTGFDKYIEKRMEDPAFAKDYADAQHEIGICDCRDCESLRMRTTLPLYDVKDMTSGKCPDEPHTHSWNVPLSMNAMGEK